MKFIGALAKGAVVSDTHTEGSIFHWVKSPCFGVACRVPTHLKAHTVFDNSLDSVGVFILEIDAGIRTEGFCRGCVSVHVLP